jgi:hypothetical protein
MAKSTDFPLAAYLWVFSRLVATCGSQHAAACNRFCAKRHMAGAVKNLAAWLGQAVHLADRIWCCLLCWQQSCDIVLIVSAGAAGCCVLPLPLGAPISFNYMGGA